MDRYLKITAWLAKRFTVNNNLVLSIGYHSSRYSMLEDMAWKKYAKAEGKEK